MREYLRDQMIGLSWAMLLTGLVLLPLEWLILEPDAFMGILYVLLTPLLLGALGLWWFKLRAPAPQTTVSGGQHQDTPGSEIGDQ